METIMNLFDGRIGRRTYLIRCLIPALIEEILNIVNRQNPIGVLYWILIIALETFVAIQTVKRFHDLGHKGIMAALMYVPGVNEIIFIILVFKRGQSGENIYGPDPIGY